MGICACQDRTSSDQVLIDFWERNLINKLSHLDYSLVIGIGSLKPTNIDVVKKSLLHLFCQEYYHLELRDECTEFWNLAFRKYNDHFLEFLTAVLFLCENNMLNAMICFKEIVMFKVYFDKSKSNKWYNRNLLCSSITGNEKNVSDTSLFVGHYTDTLEIYLDLVLNLPRNLITDLKGVRSYSSDLIRSYIKRMVVSDQLNYSTDDTESDRKFKESTELCLGDFFIKNYETLVNISKLNVSLNEYSVQYEEIKKTRRSVIIGNLMKQNTEK